MLDDAATIQFTCGCLCIPLGDRHPRLVNLVTNVFGTPTMPLDSMRLLLRVCRRVAVASRF